MPGSDRDLAREVLLDEPCFEISEQHSFGPLAAVDATYQRCEDADRLQAALAMLPGDQREIMVLRHDGGLTFVQIACRGGRSVDAIKRCYYQVIADLRGRLAMVGC